MARWQSLLLWSVVFGFLAAASLYAAEPKEPKSKHEKAPAAKRASHESDDPFAGPEESSTPGAKAPHRGKGPVGRLEKRAAPQAKKAAKPVAKALRPEENVARIEAALASPTEVNFVETPLAEVIEVLKTQHAIEIQIDTKALEDAGIGTDAPVTADLKGISLRSALRLMLRKLSLTWLIDDEVLMITTPEEAENRLSTKVYDVADLVVCRDDHDALWDDYDALIDIITATIKPTTWSAPGGPGDIRGNGLGTAKVLIVSQTQDVQEEIASLLKGIREVAKENPNAGVPRRNKAVSPAPQRQLHAGAPIGPPAYGDPLAIPKQEGSGGSPAAQEPSKQGKQPSKTETPKTAK